MVYSMQAHYVRLLTHIRQEVRNVFSGLMQGWTNVGLALHQAGKMCLCMLNIYDIYSRVLARMTCHISSPSSRYHG